MSKKIRKGDLVMAMAGNDKGRTGVVLGRDGDKVLVQGLKMCKKHVKRSEANPNGGTVELERPIHVSSLCLCLNDETPIRLKTRENDAGEREFFYHENGENISYRTVKKPK